MKLDEQTELYFKQTLGIRPLSAATGLEAFVRGLASEKSQFAVLQGVQEKVELAWGLRTTTPAPAAPASPASSTQSGTEPISGERDGVLSAVLPTELPKIGLVSLKLTPRHMSPLI